MFKMLILLLSTTAVAACSFKRNPDLKQPQVVLIQEEKVPAKEKTLEDIISQEDEQHAINDLVGKRDSIFKRTDANGPSPLDLAVKFGKAKVVEYLIVNQMSPFYISEETYRKIEYNDPVARLVLAAQSSKIKEILHTYSSAVEVDRKAEPKAFDIFRGGVESLALGSRGCQKLFDSLVDIRYFTEKAIAREDFENFRNLQNDSLLKRVYSETSCKNFVGNIANDTIRKWLGHEFLYQFQRNFESTDFLRFLLSLSTVDSIDLTVSNNTFQYDDYRDADYLIYASQVRLDPMALVYLKRPCFNSGQDFDDWKDIVNRIRSNYESVYFYSYDQSKDTVRENCGSSKSCTYLSRENNAALYVSLRVLGRANLREDDFKINYENLINNLATESSSKFKALLCKQAEDGAHE